MTGGACSWLARVWAYPLWCSPGDRYLKGALGIAALSVVKRKQTYFWAKYQRITVRRGLMRALMSVEHAMVVAAWHMLTNGRRHRLARHPLVGGAQVGQDAWCPYTPSEAACDAATLVSRSARRRCDGVGPRRRPARHW